MTDTGPPPNVNALVEALEARARQAGSEGAMTLLRGMLGTVSETMSSIEERLGRIEAHADDQSGEMALAEAVQSALTSFNARLGRLEEAFVQAVEESGSGTQQIVDQIREAVVASLPSPAPDAPADRSDTGPPPPPPSAAEVAGEVVGGLRRLLESHTSALAQRFNAIDQRLGALERVEDTVQQLRDRPPPEPPPPSPTPVEPAPPALDPERVARREAAIDALNRDEASARTVALVEERIAAVVKVIGERSEEVRDAVRQEFESMPRPAPPPAPPPAPEPLDLSALTRIEEEVRRLAERPLPEPPPPPVAPPPIEIPVYELSDIVRRESELLTQRVAALAVGVEATRALLEQVAADMEASLGRKATEVGRRLATDLGLRSRRTTRRRDRELGPGA